MSGEFSHIHVINDPPALCIDVLHHAPAIFGNQSLTHAPHHIQMEKNHITHPSLSLSTADTFRAASFREETGNGTVIRHHPHPSSASLLRQMFFLISAATLLVGRQEGHLACKTTGCWFVAGDDLTGALHVL